MEPDNQADNDLLHYKIELVDMAAVSSNKEDAGPSADFESSANRKPDIVEPISKVESQKTKRKKRASYSDAYLEETVNHIRNGTLQLSSASKLTGIPRTTLQYRLSPGFKNKGTTGPCTIFSADEENVIVKWLKGMVRKGFPITRRRIEYKVSNYLKLHPRKNPFNDNKPGITWSKCFVQRHPALNVSNHRSATEADIRSWFKGIRSFLEDNQLTAILQDPSRILLGNDAGFALHCTSKTVIDKLHRKYVSFTDTDDGNHNMTVMFTIAANGSSLPPEVVLPLKRLSPDLQKSFPSEWGLGTSPNGWLDVRNFSLYVMKVLYPALVKRGVQFPVLYFMDGHKSEVASETADLCKQYGIILIALYPNASQILKQSDATPFKPLKITWTNISRTWRSNNKTTQMKLATFSSLLEKAMNASLNKTTIASGFTVCGLYPFSSNGIDFNKYRKVFPKDQALNNEGNTEDMPRGSGDITDVEYETTDRLIEIPASVLKTALRMLGPSKIKLYQTALADDLSYEDKVLSFVYRNILSLAEFPAHDSIPESSACIENAISEPTSLVPDDDSVYLEFDVTMDIKIENDIEESTDMIVGSRDCDRENSQSCDNTIIKVESTSDNCQQNIISSNYSGETSNGADCFAKEHICRVPRITTHFCPAVKETKYHSCFLDVTAMYIAYLDACHKSSQEPVSSKVYNDILLKERTKDPPLPSRCDDCQHVEKFDPGELSCVFSNK